jgi:hypothetical protein
MRLVKFAAVLLLLGIAAVGFVACFTNSEVHLVEEHSFFDDFRIEGSEAFISCDLTFYNPHDAAKKFTVHAWAPEDVEGGLLAEPKLVTIYPNGKSYFELEGKATGRFEIEFVGQFGGSEQKMARLLPSRIEVVELD